MRPALALPVLAALLLAQPAAAQVAAPDSGDTGWMIACALLLLLAAMALAGDSYNPFLYFQF